jgi:prevent-host-death family protein
VATLKRNLTTTEARARFYRLVDEVAEAHEPVYIAGKRADAVLVSAEDWNAVQETLYLLAIPGMRESIVAGMKTPLSKTSQKPGW